MARRQTQIIIKFGLALVGAVALSGAALAATPASDGVQAVGNTSNTSSTVTQVGNSGPGVTVTSSHNSSSGLGNGTGTVSSDGSPVPTTGTGSKTQNNNATLSNNSNDSTNTTDSLSGTAQNVSGPNDPAGTSIASDATIQQSSTQNPSVATTVVNTPVRNYHYVVTPHEVPSAPAPQVSATAGTPPPANHPAPSFPNGAAAFRDTAIVVPSVEHNHFDLTQVPVALRSLGLALGLVGLTVMISSVLGSLFLLHQQRTGFSLAPRGPGAGVLQFATQQSEFKVRSILTENSLFNGAVSVAKTTATGTAPGLKTKVHSLKMLQGKEVTT